MNLAVIETRWWQSGNHSVKGMFDVLWDMFDHRTRFHYEMFVDRGSLQRIIERIMVLYRRPHIRHLYIAGHGDDDGIYGAEGCNRISRTQLRNDVLNFVPFRASGRRGGLYVSSCKFGNFETVNFLIERGVSERLRWIAGYANEVDWIDSSIVDMFFWNAYYQSNENTEIGKITEVGEKFNSFMPGAYRDLGFQVFLFQNGNENLLLS